MKVKQVGHIYGNKSRTGRVYDPDGICPCLITPSGGGAVVMIVVKQATKKGYIEVSRGGALT